MRWLRFFRRRSDLDLTREIAAHINEERAEFIARSLSSSTHPASLSLSSSSWRSQRQCAPSKE
jgi:hypothetical protein